MKLPPVDQFREPFVVPLGHVAMQAAYADEKLALLCAAASADGGDPETPDSAAHKLRNWDGAARKFASDCLEKIGQFEVRASALEALDEYETLRTQRHRAIHDSISVGIYGDAGTGYEARPLAVEYKRGGGQTTQQLRKTTPDEIADVAYRLYEVQKTFECIAYQLDAT